MTTTSNRRRLRALQRKLSVLRGVPEKDSTKIGHNPFSEYGDPHTQLDDPNPRSHFDYVATWASAIAAVASAVAALTTLVYLSRQETLLRDQVSAAKDQVSAAYDASIFQAQFEFIGQYLSSADKVFFDLAFLHGAILHYAGVDEGQKKLNDDLKALQVEHEKYNILIPKPLSVDTQALYDRINGVDLLISTPPWFDAHSDKYLCDAGYFQQIYSEVKTCLTEIITSFRPVTPARLRPCALISIGVQRLKTLGGILQIVKRGQNMRKHVPILSVPITLIFGPTRPVPRERRRRQQKHLSISSGGAASGRVGAATRDL
jgi:hypothetical protein